MWEPHSRDWFVQAAQGRKPPTPRFTAARAYVATAILGVVFVVVALALIVREGIDDVLDRLR